MRHLIALIILTLVFFSCQKEQNLPIGKWRAEIYMQEDTLPFNFEVQNEDSLRLFLLNGEERLKIEDIQLKEDSVIIQMHIFDSEIRAKHNGKKLSGFFHKKYDKNYKLGFKAVHGEDYRFSKNPKSDISVDGKWEVQFESALQDSTKAIGKFEQSGSYVRGTFLTKTGDYRFLEGEMDGDQLRLSCFDGEHAFLFEAEIDSSNTLKGQFKSGKSWNESWVATRNDSIELENAFELTYLKEGYDSLFFSFRDLEGNQYNYPNQDTEGKVVLIQIFATWCPNCMDETKFLSAWYDKNKDKGVEIIAIDFERKDDINYAKKRIERLKDKIGINYKFLFGGPADKEFASRAFPMLNRIISWPTLIFIDRKGEVRNIHTGFSGPGTGKYYDDFLLEFDSITNTLLNEIP